MKLSYTKNLDFLSGDPFHLIRCSSLCKGWRLLGTFSLSAEQNAANLAQSAKEYLNRPSHRTKTCDICINKRWQDIQNILRNAFNFLNLKRLIYIKFPAPQMNTYLENGKTPNIFRILWFMH